MKLSHEQLTQFKQDGFIVLKQFASHTLCDAILQKAQHHLALKIAPIESEQEYMQIEQENTTVRRLRQVYEREPEFQAWMTHPDIRPILKQLLGDNPVLTLAHHNSIMTKMPFESSRTFWHQDRRYWHFNNDELLSVWLSLGDEVLDNGLLEFIPNSHTINFDKEQFDEDANFLDEHPKK
jgi:phytanoyl-CoA hydroxylase